MSGSRRGITGRSDCTPGAGAIRVGFTLITPDLLIPQPRELVLRNGTPDTIAGWKALADGLLTDQSCAFHRNLEISSRYAWIYKYLPACFKWAGMAAFASHHVRLALFPLRLDTDRTGYVDIPHSLGRRKALLITDVNTIRETNNAHLQRHLLGAPRLRHRRRRDRAPPRPPATRSPTTPPSSPASRRSTEDAASWRTRRRPPEARRAAEDLIWKGNVQLLEHEQRALVQPNLDRLSCAFARLFSIGSALSFEVRGRARRGLVLHLVLPTTRSREGSAQALHAQAWPRITRFDDRWRWIVTSIVPRFRRLDADMRLVDASLRRIFDEARDYASNPCVLPRA